MRDAAVNQRRMEWAGGGVEGEGAGPTSSGAVRAQRLTSDRERAGGGRARRALSLSLGGAAASIWRRFRCVGCVLDALRGSCVCVSHSCDLFLLRLFFFFSFFLFPSFSPNRGTLPKFKNNTCSACVFLSAKQVRLVRLFKLYRSLRTTCSCPSSCHPNGYGSQDP